MPRRFSNRASTRIPPLLSRPQTAIAGLRGDPGSSATSSVRIASNVPFGPEAAVAKAKIQWLEWGRSRPDGYAPHLRHSANLSGVPKAAGPLCEGWRLQGGGKRTVRSAGHFLGKRTLPTGVAAPVVVDELPWLRSKVGNDARPPQRQLHTRILLSPTATTMVSGRVCPVRLREQTAPERKAPGAPCRSSPVAFRS